VTTEIVPETSQDVTPVDTQVTDVSFARAEADKLYRSGFMRIHPHRWQRVLEEVRFEDVVEKLIGSTEMTISCPFHGRDSKPSFHLYKRTNDAFCFGCPPGEQYYDAVKFASKRLGVSESTALRWVEDQFGLPPMKDIPFEETLEEEKPEFLEVTFRELLPSYVQHAARDIQNSQDVELAEEYLEILFDAWPSREEEKKDPVNSGDALSLARVVGQKVVDAILKKKVR
jgi:hypothetical protein